MKMQAMIEGMQILSKYFEDPNGHNCEAEHDVLYVYGTDREVEAIDIARLIELGWTQDVSHDGEEFTVADYYREESWMAFT